MHRALVSGILLFLACAGCAQLNTQLTQLNAQLTTVAHNVRSYLPREPLITSREEQAAPLQQQFESRKGQIEQRALNGEITWSEAAREIRKLHRRSGLDFDKADEDFHTYNAAVAEQLDAGRLTFAQYDALRTQRLNELQRRRAK